MMGSGQGAGIQCQTLQQDVRWEAGDQQWRQEVKIAPASRPSSLVPGQDLGSGPGAILGPGRVTIPGGRSPPSQAAMAPAQPTEEGREGPEREEGRPGRWGQAEA